MALLDDREPDLQSHVLAEVLKKEVAEEITWERGYEICHMLDVVRSEYYGHKISYEELEKRSWDIIKKELG